MKVVSIMVITMMMIPHSSAVAIRRVICVGVSISTHPNVTYPSKYMMVRPRT